MATTSALVPLAGLASAPLLTRSLGVDGRGAVASALAPGLLIASCATLGLPESLTFYAARYTRLHARSIVVSLALVSSAGLLVFGLVLTFLPYFSGGSASLGKLIIVATAITFPQLQISLIRGLAAGLQLWGLVAAERAISALLRVGVLAVLAVGGNLTVVTAVIASTVVPCISAVPYLFVRVRTRGGVEESVHNEPVELVRFGLSNWLGTIATILLARTGQLFFVPLSGTQQLGLYVVALTISDIPLIVAISIRDALYGLASKEQNAEMVSQVSRCTVFLGLVGSLLVGLTLPLWIGPIFGQEFVAALPTTWLMMLTSVINIPTFLVAAALAAWGRPGLRSIGVTIGLLLYVPPFFYLVPNLGAFGAGLAGLLSISGSTIFLVAAGSRVLAVPWHRFLVLQRSDYGLLLRFTRQKLRPRHT